MVGSFRVRKSNILRNNSKFTEIPKDFKPYLYNIWNIGKTDNESKLHGAFPSIFMENLVYRHTKVFEIIYDPFAGSGTTIDICKKWYRRYYCSDRKVQAGREKDILKWDITKGLPEDLPKPNMVFLDPPYRAQAKGKYSKDSCDLGNMNLEDYLSSLFTFLSLLKKKRIQKIVIVTAPCYKTRDHDWEDYIFYMHEVLFDKYRIVARYILPYSTEEYRGSQVNVAKEMNVCMSTIRDLVVWELK